jgi:hypothetical protein
MIEALIVTAIYSVIALIFGLIIKYIDENYDSNWMMEDDTMLGLTAAIWPISLFFICIIATCTFVGRGLSWVYNTLEDKFTK